MSGSTITVHFGRMLLDMALRMTCRGSPLKRGVIEITTKNDTPADARTDTSLTVGNCALSVRRNEASNGICLRMWFSVTGLPVSRPWKIGFLRCVMAVIFATGLSEGGV